MPDNNDRRKPYRGDRARGAGRRTYPNAAGPRVGRVARDVPRAQRVDADAAPDFDGADTRRPDAPYRGNVPRDDRRPDGPYRGNAPRDDRRPDAPYRGNAPRDDRRPDAPYRGNAPRDDRRPDGPYRGNDRRDDGPRHDGPRRDGDHPRPDAPRAALHRGDAYRAPSGPRQYKRADAAPEPPEDFEADGGLLAGRNPIREALKAGQPVEKLLVAEGDLSGSAREIIRLAREAGAVVQQVERSRLDQIYPAHQGMLAYVAAAAYVELGDLLAAAAAKGEDPFLILLDGITDPHNLGAIVRSAECAGAHGVVIPERRAVGLTPAAAKAAAGALSRLPVARVKNLNRAIEELQAQNVWVVGTAMDGENALEADLSGPIALVIGSEGDGVARLTLEKCDRTVTLPMLGHIGSLNASVAAGILMYEVVRARARR